MGAEGTPWLVFYADKKDAGGHRSGTKERATDGEQAISAVAGSGLHMSRREGRSP